MQPNEQNKEHALLFKLGQLTVLFSGFSSRFELRYLLLMISFHVFL